MIGARIREFRKQKGLTIEQLGGQYDLSTSYLSQIETGTRHGSIEAVKAIANALGVPLDQFFSGVDMKEDELDLLEVYRGLDAVDKAAVLRHAKALVRQEEMRRIMK